MSKVAPAQVPFTALVVDDEELYAQAIRRELERAGVVCELAFSAREALHKAESQRYQTILLDHRLPDDDGLRLIPLLLARQHGAALIMMTAYQTIPNAVEAIRLGADDYLVKETSLQPLVQRVLELQRREELRRAAGTGQDLPRQTLLGRSPKMAEVVAQLQKTARSPETTVLINGETGVGKEVACRFLHSASRPEASPLVAVDCLALPENLAESLLFGHEKGAFTGADQSRAGAFEEARDGTAFLDEIGDMSSALQGKLLRVLESRVFRRVGSSKEIPLRARVVAATNRDLRELVEQGCFRQDLYQRLSVFPVVIPPLRERGDDVLVLAEHFRAFFAEKLAKEVEPLSEAVAERLMAYDYPGNVRELKNIIERALISAEGSRIEVKHLPQRVLEIAAR
ncbi:MAG: sigma-54-dependent Fis family transcriptional regulator, partial [Deltaproteobacteria bacterium]|nr:sigma-54-dependent Fis family transcriptional regulator [Deltaproteobacteria bacterium]